MKPRLLVATLSLSLLFLLPSLALAQAPPATGGVGQGGMMQNLQAVQSYRDRYGVKND